MDQARDPLRKYRKPLIGVAFIAIVTGLFWPESKDSQDNLMVTGESASEVFDDSGGAVEPVEPVVPTYQEFTYTIQTGDTLGSIFSKLQLPAATMYRLLEADEDFLQLDSLMPGQRLAFIREGEDLLVTRMQMEIDRIQLLDFVRDGDIYAGELIIHETTPVERTVHGVIQGSLYASAARVGLTPGEIDTISRLFEEKINFARDFRAGDSFKILFDDLYVDGKPTGRSTLKAVVINTRRRELAAYLHDDGQYYDEAGRSLNRAFLKRPLKIGYRISSSFNPSRVHPVTGRVSAHNGTDYATPIGTPILTISDGVVTRAGNHPIAGKYVNIQHTDRYSTRYLHLSKINVRQGQRVEIGDVIGLSGMTGRVTGPHLHFELHVEGRPVDFVRYSLPEARQLDDQQMIAFRSLMRTYLVRMHGIIARRVRGRRRLLLRRRLFRRRLLRCNNVNHTFFDGISFFKAAAVFNSCCFFYRKVEIRLGIEVRCIHHSLLKTSTLKSCRIRMEKRLKQ